DVVLLDLNLPDADGVGVLAALRALPGFNAPVLVLTGGSGEPARRAIEAGAEDFLNKDDLTASVLTSALRNAITRAGLKRRLEEALARAEAELSERRPAENAA